MNVVGEPPGQLGEQPCRLGVDVALGGHMAGDSAGEGLREGSGVLEGGLEVQMPVGASRLGVDDRERALDVLRELIGDEGGVEAACREVP